MKKTFNPTLLGISFEDDSEPLGIESGETTTGNDEDDTINPEEPNGE